MSWKVHLTWDEGAPSAQGTGFKVYKSTDGGSYSLVATLGISITSWDDTSVAEGHKYSYHVTEYNTVNGGESPYASKTVYMPSINTEITAKVRIDGSVDVAWDQRTYNLGYRIERQTDGGAWGLVTEVGTNVTSYQDSVGTTTNKTYKYRVRPKGTTGYAPTYLESSLHYYATKKVHVTWDEGGTSPAAAHGDGYKIYRKVGTGDYELWKTITGIGTTYYDDPDITDGTYYYKVAEWKDDLEDEPAEVSISVTLNTAPTAPTGLLCEGATNPQAVSDTTPEFSAIGNDPDSGDTLTYAYIQVNTSSAFDGTSMWDSGWLDIVDFAEGSRSPDISYAGTALSRDGSTLYWRIKFKDAAGAEGAWSEAASFRMQWVQTFVKQESVAIDDGDHAVGERLFTEGVSVADGLARSGQATRTHAEAITVQDSCKREADISVLDPISVSGFLARAGVFVKDETVLISDGDHAVGERLFTESVVMSDGQVRGLWVAARAHLESLGVSDGKHVSGMRALFEPISMEDSIWLAVFKVFSEAIGIADAVHRAGTIPAEESVQMSDLVTSIGSRAIEDNIQMSAESYAHGERAFSESVDVVDALAPLVAMCLFQESIQVSDGDHAAGERVFVEAVGMSDQAISDGARAFFEALAMNDAVAPIQAMIKAVESIAMTDTVNRGAVRIFADALVMTADAVLHGERAFSESIPIDDAEFIAAVRALEDGIAMSDHLTRIKLCSEAISMAEGLYRHLEFNRVGDEPISMEDRVGLKGGSAHTEPPYDCKMVIEQLKAELQVEVI